MRKIAGDRREEEMGQGSPDAARHKDGEGRNMGSVPIRHHEEFG